MSNLIIVPFAEMQFRVSGVRYSRKVPDAIGGGNNQPISLADQSAAKQIAGVASAASG
jgi:hypothetical protein